RPLEQANRRRARRLREDGEDARLEHPGQAPPRRPHAGCALRGSRRHRRPRMSLFVERYADADSFLDRAAPFLLAREAAHNLILGLPSRLRDNPRRFGSDPYFATVSGTEGEVVAAALRTPPHNLVLSEIDEHDVCHAFAADVAEVFDSLRGVLAPSGR